MKIFLSHYQALCLSEVLEEYTSATKRNGRYMFLGFEIEGFSPFRESNSQEEKWLSKNMKVTPIPELLKVGYKEGTEENEILS